MGDSNGPTYASLTPVNPSIINGLANVDLQTVTQQYPTQSIDQPLSAVTGVLSNENSPTMVTTASVESPATTPDVSSEITDTAQMDRNTLVAVLQFLKKNGLQVN